MPHFYSQIFLLIEQTKKAGGKCFFVAPGGFAGDSYLFKEFSIHTSSEYLRYDDLSGKKFSCLDLVIFVNIDNPSLFMPYLQDKPLPCQTILYTLYHPRPGIIELSLFKRFGLSLPRPLTQSIFLEYLYNLFKYFPYLPTFSLKHFLRHLQYPLDIICNRFSFLCCVSPQESKSILSFTSYPSQKVLLQSHLPLSPPSSPPQTYHSKPFFLTVGRAESRKNLLRLANIAPLFPEHDFLIVSSKSPSEQHIIKDLRLLTEEYPNLLLLEDLTPDQIYYLIKESKCVINTSYFEVMSLIDLTAISLSVPLITTVNSFIPSSTMSSLHYPSKSFSLYSAISHFLSR